jgi:hypothetical protein
MRPKSKPSYYVSQELPISSIRGSINKLPESNQQKKRKSLINNGWK